MTPLHLHPGEHIAAVVPGCAAGPGWRNTPLWVHIHNHSTGTFRSECIQPEDQTPQMATLFRPGAAMCEALIACVPVRKGKA